MEALKEELKRYGEEGDGGRSVRREEEEEEGEAAETEWQKKVSEIDKVLDRER